MSASRQAARPAKYRRSSVGASSTARSRSLRALRNASRESARFPAWVSAAAASSRRSGGRRAVELGEQGRGLVEVERADLEQLDAGALAEPVGERTVQVGARALRETGVRHLADEHVLDLERLLAVDGRARLAHDEVAEQELVERGMDVVHLRRQPLQRPEHEDPAHHGGALEQQPLRAGQPVDARGDERLQRVRDPLGAAARALREHAHGLLDVERVALGLREHGLGVDADVELRRQRRDELGALLGRQRLELDGGGADAAAAPGRAHVEELGARDAEQQQRDLAHPGGEMLDELQQRLLAPVHVLEQEHERLRLGELLGPRARRPGDLLLGPHALDRLEHADGEAEQVGDRLVLAAGAQLRARLVERVVVGDPGRRLHHLGERPVRDAFAVGEAAAARGRSRPRARRRTRARAGSSRRRGRRRS